MTVASAGITVAASAGITVAAAGITVAAAGITGAAAARAWLGLRSAPGYVVVLGDPRSIHLTAKTPPIPPPAATCPRNAAPVATS